MNDHSANVALKYRVHYPYNLHIRLLHSSHCIAPIELVPLKTKSNLLDATVMQPCATILTTNVVVTIRELLYRNIFYTRVVQDAAVIGDRPCISACSRQMLAATN